MKITKLETFGNEFVTFTRVTSETGATGWGQLSTYNADITATVFHRQIAPWSLGADAYDIGMLTDDTMVVLGLLPKMAALVESVPTFVLGGAGLVMFGMVAATGIRILANVDYKTNRNNLFVVAISIGFGMIPLIAPNFKQWMPHGIHPLIESGILLASISAVALNLYFNGADADSLREWREGLYETRRNFLGIAARTSQRFDQTFALIQRTQMLEKTLRTQLSPQMSAALRFSRTLGSQVQ